MKKWLRRKCISFLAKDLYNTVTEADVLQVRDGKVFHGKRELNQIDLNNLAEQAEYIISSDIWRLVMNDMQLTANKQIYHESKTVDDLVSAKLILWTLDVMARKFLNVKLMKK